MREDKIHEAEDEIIDLGAASQVTLGIPKVHEFELALGQDFREKAT